MQTIRSFIAIPLDAGVQKTATRLVKRLAQDKDGIKWVPTDNLHLTLKFLGDVDNVEIPRIYSCIQNACEGIEPFSMTFTGITALPSLEKARTIVSSIDEPTGSLVQLVNNLERLLADLGFRPEPRDYVPHLTLGRNRGGSRRASEDVLQGVQKEKDSSLGMIQADTVQLMASFLDKAGPTYQVMGTIEF